MDPTQHSETAIQPHTIRTITRADIAAFQTLRLAGLIQHPEAFGETAEHFNRITEDQIASRLHTSEASGGFILGAFALDGTLVGTVGLAREEGEKTKHRAIIWGMYVSPQARKTGLGRALMQECLDRAKRIQGLEQVQLSVVTLNTNAFKLYQSLGFEAYGTDPRVLKVGAQYFDEYLMIKRI